MSKTKAVYGDSISTPVGRLAYSYLDKKDEGRKNSSGKYSARLLMKKEDMENDEDYVALVEEIERIAEEAGLEIDDLTYEPIVDGDGTNRKKKPYPESHHGHMFLNAKSDRKPDIYVLNDEGEVEEIEDESTIKELVYAGCYVSLVVQPFIRDVEEGTVGWLLQGVLKVSDGERFGNDVDTESYVSNWASKYAGKFKKDSSDKKDKAKKVLKTKKAKETEDTDSDEVEEEAPKKTRKKSNAANDITSMLGRRKK